MIVRVIKFGAATGASLVLMGGVALATPASITNTGAHSTNKITSKTVEVCKVINKNNVATFNFSSQKAKTGNAKVNENTTASGDATSGPAANTNTATASVDLANNPSDNCVTCPCNEVTVDGTTTISGTGKKSKNTISIVDVNKNVTVNVNNVFTGNVSVQSATSGSATVSENTSGGDANSGSAINTNTATITVTASNN